MQVSGMLLVVVCAFAGVLCRKIPDATTESLSTFPDTGALSTTTFYPTETTEAGETTTASPIVCPDGALGNVTFFPNPNNCSEYFECDNGELKVMECPDGLLWNVELNVCDFAENVECEAQEGKAAVEADALPDCSGRSHSSVLFPNPDNCAQYFQCDNGKAQLMNCPPGLQFNPQLNVCDFESNVHCVDEPVYETTIIYTTTDATSFDDYWYT